MTKGGGGFVEWNGWPINSAGPDLGRNVRPGRKMSAGDKDLHVSRFGVFKACAVILIATVLALPIGGVMNIMIGSAAAEDDGGTLRVGFLQKVDSLNPNVGLVDAAYIFYGLVYDTLQCVDEDLGIVGNIATSAEVNPDYIPYGSVWDLEITENARWHDGEPCTVDDVVFTINLNANNYAQMWAFQPYAYFMDYAEKVPGQPNTVRVHFYDRSTGDPMPAAYAEIVCIYALPEHMLRDYTASDIGFDWEGVFENSDPPIVGTGPFMATDNIYQEWLQGDKLTFVRNPNYHWTVDKTGSPVVQFEKFEMHFFDDATAMAIALENGELDIAQFPPHEYLTIKNKVQSGALQDIVAYDGPKCTQYWTEIAVNMNNAGPNPSRLDDVIRQAMAMATDKTYIVDNYYLGLADEGTTLIPPVNQEWHYEPTNDELYHYDLAAANALLESNGYRYTAESTTVRVCTADSYAVQEGLVSEGTPLVYDMAIRQEFPEEKDIAMYLESEWAKVGIDVNYRIMTEAALGAYVYGYAYDTMIWYWSADVDPNYQLFCQSKYAWNGWNDNLYSTPEYEENYTISVTSFDPAERKEAVYNCQKVNYEDAYYLILAYVYQTYGYRTDTFKGWGDWDAHPGRSMDNFWSGNPLWFDLVPTGGGGLGEVPWLAIGVGIAVIAGAVVAVVLLKSRGGKKGKEKDESSPLGD
jgi:peptide/nickel transport system substrate-binding protein